MRRFDPSIGVNKKIVAEVINGGWWADYSAMKTITVAAVAAATFLTISKPHNRRFLTFLCQITANVLAHFLDRLFENPPRYLRVLTTIHPVAPPSSVGRRQYVKLLLFKHNQAPLGQRAKQHLLAGSC